MIRAFEGAVGTENVLSDPEVTVTYGTPWAAAEGVTPLAVVRPGNAGEAAAVMRACAGHGARLVLQGGNTGMVRGGVPASPGEVVLSTVRMDAIEAVDRESASVVVGAGTTLEALQARLEPAGLELPLDLGARSQATLGGMAATNAGGTRAFRHGTMRHHVVGVEAVLADGSVIERLGGVLKDATGYDWPSILVGSEGTLALVTRLRLRLRRVERSRAAALVPVDSLAQGLALAVALRDRPAGLEAAEFVLPETLALVCEELDLRPPAGIFDDERDPASRPGTDGARSGASPGERAAGGRAAGERALVLFESRTPVGALELLVEALGDHPEAERAVLAEGADAARLWRYREGTGEALAHHAVVKLDVALPLPRLADGVAAIDRAALDAGGARVRPFLFGHLLDGNVHVNLGAVPDARRERVERAVLETVLAHGGSIGAEHGIGRAKVAWLAADRSAADIAAMRSLKQALDPTGLLSPGVLFD
ncbi:MAG: FAD-binding oxidoreductase [Actinobacteria bacterium]|nr:FAD-binding oxidoreductase [Actinomycetota bacterium]